MKVNKIYQTMQGEGPNVGRPAVFIELSDKGKRMKIEQILQALLKSRPGKLLVITGEEPMEQMHELGDMPKSLLHQIKYHPNLYFDEVEVETGGMIVPSENMYWLTESFVITPRIFTQESAATYDQFWIKALNVVSAKLMIKTKKDLEVQMNWIKNLVKAPMISHDIFVVPNATKDKEIKEIARWLVPTCINEGFRLSPRLRLWLEEV